MQSLAALLDRPVPFVLAMLLPAVAAMLRITLAAPYGLQTLGDSFYYVTGSENLAALRGFGRLSGGGDFIPITHYPPFLSAAMAVLQLVGMAKLQSAFWVNLLSYAGLTLIVGWLVKLQTRSAGAAMLPALLIGLSPILLETYLFVLSEPLFLALGFSGLLLLWLHLRSGSWATLLSSAALLAMTWLTRYLGIALIGAGAVILLLRGPPIRVRIRRVVAFLGVSALPTTLWMLRNLLLTGNVANRRVLWHPLTYQHLRAFTLHVLEWFVPAELVRGMLVAIGWLVIAGGLTLWYLLARRRVAAAGEGAPARHLERMLLALALCYLIALVASLSLFDPSTPVDNRILAPVYVAAIVLLALALHETWQFGSRIAQGVVLGIVAFVLGWYAYVQFRDVQIIRQHALDYPPRHLIYSPTIEAVRALPQVPLISNALPSLYFSADRYSYAIPWRIHPQTNSLRSEYPAELEEIRRRLRDDCAVLILMNPERHLPEQAPLEDLTEGLVLMGQYSDGVLYRFAGAEETCGW